MNKKEKIINNKMKISYFDSVISKLDIEDTEYDLRMNFGNNSAFLININSNLINEYKNIVNPIRKFKMRRLLRNFVESRITTSLESSLKEYKAENMFFLENKVSGYILDQSKKPQWKKKEFGIPEESSWVKGYFTIEPLKLVKGPYRQNKFKKAKESTVIKNRPMGFDYKTNNN